MDAKLRASRERPHGSAGGEGIRRHRMRFSVTSRHPGSVEQPPARLRGTMGNGSTGQMRSSNPPPACGALWGMAQLGKCARATPRQAAGRLARGSANLGLESGLTERRTLRHPLEVRSHRVRLSVRNGDTHSRHTRRLSTSQTHKAGHPSPHCHLILNVLVLHVHRRVAV